MIFMTPMTRLAAWTLAPIAAASLAIGAPAIAQSASTLSSVQSHLNSTSSMTASLKGIEIAQPRIPSARTPPIAAGRSVVLNAL